MNNHLTILYELLSQEDERENESVSIENQKEFLEYYATKNSFTNIVHMPYDGWSGVRLIAVAEGIDTAKGEFMPFRNIIAE